MGVAVTKPVFVSSLSNDVEGRETFRRLAESLGLALLELGTMEPGRDWKTEVRRMISNASCVVVLVGKETFRSEFVDWEIAQAADSGVPLVAVTLSGPSTQLPKGLEHVVVVDIDSQDVAARLLEFARPVTENYLSALARSIAAELPPSAIPEGPVNELMIRYAVLLLAKGTAVTGADVHNAWSAWMTAADPSHSAIVPYDELDDATAAQDEPYVAAIRGVARRLAQVNEPDFQIATSE